MILSLHTLPESKYDVSHAQITRTDAIQTASFARMSENYEYYFVPYSQLFQGFERLYYERGDVQRNSANSQMFAEVGNSSYVPRFDYESVVFYLAKYFVVSRLYRLMETSNKRSAEKWLFSYHDSYNPSSISSSLLPFDVHGEICIDEMLKLFDMAGYGNLFGTFNSLISPFFGFDLPSYFISPASSSAADIATALNTLNKAFATSLAEYFGCVMTWNSTTNVPTFSSQYSNVVGAFYDAFHAVSVTSVTGVVSVVPAWSDISTIPNITTWITTFTSVFMSESGATELYDFLGQDSLERYPSVLTLAAYVKVFSDIYRNTQFDTVNYSSLFNFDYVTTDVLASVSDDKVLALLLPRFRQYKKDVFTGVFPNAQFGSVAVSSLQSPSEIFMTDLNSSGSVNVQISGATSSTPYRLQANTAGYPHSFDIKSGVSALAIRQALSLQRYKERILRAGNRLTALQNAVFGDRSRFLENNYVQFIGAEHNMIDFNAVAATSDAGQSEVGQLGGHGVGTHVGKCFEFHSHDFGIIVGIYYILPESEYENYMIDPQNTKTESNDFYKPDFMNLGLSPVFNYNFNVLDGYSDSVLGYLANYWEYKTSIDKVHGNFYSSYPTSDYFRHSGDTDGLPKFEAAQAFSRGQNSYYVTPRSATAFSQALMLGNLYVNPHDIDCIFYVNSDFTLDSDQFKCNCNHEIKALLPMSVVGLPEY